MNIQSVQRAMAILSRFSYARPAMGITEIARDLGLSKTTIHGLVRTLEQGAFLQQDPETRKYRLGLKLYELGSLLAGTSEINVKASGPVHRLAESTGLIVRLAIWDHDATLATLHASPGYREALSHQVGPRVAAYCSSIGRVFLAHMSPQELHRYLERTPLLPFTAKTITNKKSIMKELEETRRRGFAVNREEITIGRASIAVPVRDKRGTVAAAVSLTGSPIQLLGDEMDRYADELFRTAGEVSRALGYFPKAMPTGIRS